jgi:transcriptional regulator with XRE-family HTH domain
MDSPEGVEAGLIERLYGLGPERLGALLRSIRIQRMQSRRDVARRVDANGLSLLRWERGEAPVPHDMLVALVAYFGQDVTARFERGAARTELASSNPARVDTTAPPSEPPDPAPPDPNAPDLAVETVLADFALARLGTLLQSTREERSDSRRAVASQMGLTPRELRRYETGRAPVPRGVLTSLAEFYGDDLDARFGHRRVQPADADAVESVEDIQVHSGDGDEALGTYVEIIRRRQEAAPDEPLALQPEEVAALSTALAVEPEQVGGRVAELVNRTTRLRRHSRQRRRKRIVSGAGLGIALATGCGFAFGSMIGALPSRASEVTAEKAPITVSIPSTTTTATTSTTNPPPPPPPETTVATIPELPPPPVTDTTPPPTFVYLGPAVTAVAPTTTSTIPRPVITDDTTPVSIPDVDPPIIIVTTTT